MNRARGPNLVQGKESFFAEMVFKQNLKNEYVAVR